MQSTKSATVYVDLPGYLSPCSITGDKLRPDIILTTADNVLYIIELTVGFEANLSDNAHRKELRYCPIFTDLVNDHMQVNLLFSALAVLAYLEIHLTHFASFALKESLKIAI